MVRLPHLCLDLRLLDGSRGATRLKLMALRTLVFSSDERAAQVLTQHLAEFELEAMVCPNIFSALENLAKHRFDGIIADWNDDPEATFLIKRAKELDLNRGAMVVAVVRNESEVARAYDAGAKAILLRPLESGEDSRSAHKGAALHAGACRGRAGRRGTCGHHCTATGGTSHATPTCGADREPDGAGFLAAGRSPAGFRSRGREGRLNIREERLQASETSAGLAPCGLAASPVLIPVREGVGPLHSAVGNVVHDVAATFRGSEEPPRPPLDESLRRLM